MHSAADDHSQPLCQGSLHSPFGPGCSAGGGHAVLPCRLLLQLLQIRVKQRHQRAQYPQELGTVGTSICRDRQELAAPSSGQGWVLWLQAVPTQNLWSPGQIPHLSAQPWGGKVPELEISTLSPCATWPLMQVPGEPDHSAKSSPASGLASCTHLLKTVLQELQLLLKALSSVFQRADGGERKSTM